MKETENNFKTENSEEKTVREEKSQFSKCGGLNFYSYFRARAGLDNAAFKA